MKKSAMNWTIKQVNKMYQNEKVSFDYPIQRKSGQWDLLQKSLLIHSIVDDYPIPPIYSMSEEKLYYILDGKQRLTNIFSFINDEFKLHDDTPDTFIEVEDDYFKLGGKLFSELHDEVKDHLLSQSILVYKMDDITDEEIEELFFRLNNGTPLTKQQKSKAKMGTEWAEKMETVTTHNFLKEKTNFTALQLRKADDETTVFQTLMLMDDFEWKSFSVNHVVEYVETFKEDKDNKMELVDELKEVFDYLDNAMEEKDKKLMKKIHLPAVIMTGKYAKDNDISPDDFYEWTEEFKTSLEIEDGIRTDYKEFTGAGSVKRYKVLGRVESMKNHLNEYFNLKEEDDNE